MPPQLTFSSSLGTGDQTQVLKPTHQAPEPLNYLSSPDVLQFYPWGHRL